jgi:hypothetical protein
MVSFALDVDDKLYLFNQLFINTLNDHVPIKHIRVKGRPQPFINKDIKLLMKLRQDVQDIQGNTEDWVKHKSLRNSIKINLRKAETNHVRTQIKNCKGNSRFTWKVIKESTKLCYKNNHSKIAEEFNTYFTSVGRLTADRVKELAEENGVLIPPPGPSTIPNYITPEEMFQLRSVTPNEIQRIILETPSHKAPGPDKIGFRYLKDSLDVILYPLTDIINCSLRSSKYPSTWKLAEVVEIHKDGNH